jgi:hypothetical protein
LLRHYGISAVFERHLTQTNCRGVCFVTWGVGWNILLEENFIVTEKMQQDVTVYQNFISYKYEIKF